ncbi:MAG: hypothetical protein RBS37_08970 [Bacteroidales bacterium]|jgi:hypothetical protein|nr:hypothetical protein [Bacteroidales bacterium]
MNKWAIIIIVAAGLTACMSESKTYNVKEENFEWFTPDTIGTWFLMRDDNQITQSFLCSYITNYYENSSGSFLSIKMKTTRRQTLYTEWESGYGSYFSLQVVAGEEPYGDVLTVTLNDMLFKYDLLKEDLFHVETPFGKLSKKKTNGEYVTEGTFLSEAEYLPVHMVGPATYSQVMHLKMRDFQSQWGDYTITDIYTAKFIGLVQITFSNGITIRRI